jgi:hypothetical protein
VPWSFATTRHWAVCPLSALIVLQPTKQWGWQMIDSLYPGGLVHIGALLYLVCFAFTNQIWLRSFAILGDIFYTAYYFLAADKPLWEAIAWNVPAIILNAVMIYIVLRDAKLPFLKDDELLLFRNLKGLSPAQFKTVLKGSVWQKANQPVVLTEEGKKPADLFFVLKGDVNMNKRGIPRPIPSNTFIGEVAFLQDGPASAQVEVSGDSIVVKWSHEFLNKIFKKDENMKSAFSSMMATDLASKLNERP